MSAAEVMSLIKEKDVKFGGLSIHGHEGQGITRDRARPRGR